MKRAVNAPAAPTIGRATAHTAMKAMATTTCAIR